MDDHRNPNVCTDTLPCFQDFDWPTALVKTDRIFGATTTPVAIVFDQEFAHHYLLMSLEDSDLNPAQVEAVRDEKGFWKRQGEEADFLDFLRGNTRGWEFAPELVYASHEAKTIRSASHDR